MAISLTNEQMRRFLLLKQGLLGKRRFSGEQGVLDFVRQAGCVQFDPIDVCGRNHEIVLYSRVAGFTPEMLNKLLYEDRLLYDGADKNMSILPVEDWPCFSRNRRRSTEYWRSRDKIEAVFDEILETVGKIGPVCPGDLAYAETVEWWWAPATLSKAALEALYLQGKLVIHHKKGTKRYFDLAEKQIPSALFAAADPYANEAEYYAWYFLRRIGAVGALWNKASDAWLGIPGFKAAQREAAFRALSESGAILPVSVEGILETLFIQSADMPLLEHTLGGEPFATRTELIAPLDNLLWDRKLIRALFGFDYKWEIYTPLPERKFGYYVLPLLHGDRFAGRVELVKNATTGELIVKNLWIEEGLHPSGKLKKDILACLERFAAYHRLKLSDVLPFL